MISFDALYARYQRPLSVYLLHLVKRPELAEDVSQATWLKVWQALPTVQERGIAAWLYRIAHNAACDELRRVRLRMERGEAVSIDALDSDIEDNRRGDLAERCAMGDVRARALRRLTPYQRDVLRKVGRGERCLTHDMTLSRARAAYREAMREEMSA